MLFKKYQKINFNPFNRISLFAVLGFSFCFIFLLNIHQTDAVNYSSTLKDYVASTAFSPTPVYPSDALTAPERQALISQIPNSNYAVDNFGNLYIQKQGARGLYYRDLTFEESKAINPDQIISQSSAVEQKKVAEASQKNFLTDPGGALLDSLKNFAMWIMSGILWLFSWFVWLGANLLEISIDAPAKYFNGFTTAPIVATGWEVVRDLANMFFSLILLVIAFATILRIETYGMKQVLWKLIVAALLINFSLVIAGVVIDGSNVLTNFFIKNATYNIVTKDSSGTEISNTTSDISVAILSGLKVHTLYQVNLGDTNGQSIPQNSAAPQIQGDIGFTTILINIILGIIFMLVTAFVLFAAAILFLIRLIALWILLIFAPLAWLAMILPATRNLWNKWWHEFMKWIIFAPVYGFFIYLTVSMISKNVLSQSGSVRQASAGGLAITEFTQDLRLIANYIVLIIFMVAGLIFARQSGISGATAMAKLGTNLRNAGGRMASRWAAKGGKMPGATWAANKLGLTGTLDTWQKGEGWKAGLANAVRRTGRVKETLFAAASPQVWSRYWAYRKQRADAAAFDGGAGRLDAFSTGFTGAIRNFSSASKSKQEEVTKQEAQKIFDARMRGDTTYENRDISGATVDQMMQTRGITPGTPQAEAFMRQHDWEIAQDIAKDKIVGKGAIAGLGATFDQMFGKGRLEQIAESREVGRRQQEFSQTLRDEDQIVDYYTKAKDPVDREALFRLIASINGLNTLFARLRTDFNPRNLSQYIQKNFRGGRGEVLAADVSAMAAQSGNFSFVGTTAWDASKGKIRFATEEEQKATSVKKALEMEGQAWARLTHPDSWIDRDATGAQTSISEFAKGMLDQMTAAHINQIDRFQGRTLTALYKFRNDLLTHVNTIQNPVQHSIANSFVSKLIERYEKPK